VKGKPEVSYNTSRTDKAGRKLPDGIELRFGDARPTEQVRAKLKEHGFQFSEKQVIWYAKDNARSRELIDSLEVEEWDIDNTVYEKHSFWAVVRSMKEYQDLRGWVEFMVAASPPIFYNSKKQLEARESPNSLVASKRLKFKKFYSKPVGEAEEGGDGGNDQQEDETRGDDDPNEDGNDGGDDGWEYTADISEKLARAAAAMQPQIDHKLDPPIAKQAYTHRRQRIIDGLIAEGRHMQRTQSVLLALSEVWKNGRIENFPMLKKVRSRGHVETLLSYHIFKDGESLPSTVQSSLDQRKEKLNALHVFTRFDWSDAYRQIETLLKDESPSQDPERIREQEVAQMIAKLRGKEIPGFFPTPEKEVDKMIDLAEIKFDDRVLDPSAGIGSILDRVAHLRNGHKNRIEAIEINGSLREILEKKGYLLAGRDFMAQNRESDEAFRPEKILMNPPFENGQDIEHVRHAIGFLKQGGRLVAIMGEGAFFRKRDGAFRRLLAVRNAWVSEPIQGAFKTSFNPTGVAVRMVVINQDGTRPLVGGREISHPHVGKYWTEGNGEDGEEKPDDADDMEMLELEAQAELELMLMEEEERMAKGQLNGLGSIRQEKLRVIRRMACAITDKTDVLKFN
jgi:hypothetical protein